MCAFVHKPESEMLFLFSGTFKCFPACCLQCYFAYYFIYRGRSRKCSLSVLGLVELDSSEAEINEVRGL